ncbi:hypothetical protein KBC04_00020 [Candidatus Babeliales bacterium]|nr:hypothetical protein [Candidatus Babeliales bacterium]MBP9843521.1 hypothetical protein [Candidatus Babeliales bacterium]
MKTLRQLFLLYLFFNVDCAQASDDSTLDSKCFFTDEIHNRNEELRAASCKKSHEKVKGFLNKNNVTPCLKTPEVDKPSEFDIPYEVELPSDVARFLSILLKFHNKRTPKDWADIDQKIDNLEEKIHVFEKNNIKIPAELDTLYKSLRTTEKEIEATLNNEFKDHRDQIFPILQTREIFEDDLRLVRENMLYATSAATKIQKMTRVFLNRKVFTVRLTQEQRSYLKQKVNETQKYYADQCSQDSLDSISSYDNYLIKQIPCILQRGYVSQAMFNKFSQEIQHDKDSGLFQPKKTKLIHNISKKINPSQNIDRQISRKLRNHSLQKKLAALKKMS